jgi:fluoroacetyl-CoA thioesterase
VPFDPSREVEPIHIGHKLAGVLIVSVVTIDPGLAASVELTVTEEDTALALKTGSVRVLATPRLLALCEEASVLAIAGKSGDGQTTVGLGVQFDHLRPTCVGSTVRAESHLDKVEGRRLFFTVSAKDDRGLVGVGKVTRVLVDTERFMEKSQ